MIDAVLSFHTSAYTCGVAKFSQQLAEKLRVPFGPLSESSPSHPLLSVKFKELTDAEIDAVPQLWPGFDLFAHDAPDAWGDLAPLVDNARTILAASPAIAEAIRTAFHRDVEVAHCPGLCEGNPSRGTIDVLSFGMAHKRQLAHFLRLNELLEASGYSYTVSVSTAVHEGNPWDRSMDESIKTLRTIFGSHLRVLGFLADDALSRMLRSVSHVALFYDPAARANNTTLWTALEAGVPTITNLDAHSPQELQHNVSVYDLEQLREFPTEAARHREVRHGGQNAAAAYSWDRLTALLQPSEIGA